MNFEFGDEQGAIVEATGALLARHAGAARAIALGTKGDYEFALEAALTDAGFTDLATSTETGLLDAALLVEAVARARARPARQAPGAARGVAGRGRLPLRM